MSDEQDNNLKPTEAITEAAQAPTQKKTSDNIQQGIQDRHQKSKEIQAKNNSEAEYISYFKDVQKGIDKITHEVYRETIIALLQQGREDPSRHLEGFSRETLYNNVRGYVTASEIASIVDRIEIFGEASLPEGIVKKLRTLKASENKLSDSQITRAGDLIEDCEELLKSAGSQRRFDQIAPVLNLAKMTPADRCSYEMLEKVNARTVRRSRDLAMNN